MSKVAVEAIILAINALGCGILLFVSGVVQKMMNGMEPLEFKKFSNVLGRTAMSDPLAVTIATIPIFAVIYYFVAFGFNHWWFTAGVAAWMIGSAITKVTNLLIRSATEQLHARAGNARAPGSRFVVLMACQFSIEGTATAVAACAIIAYPSLWLARKYIPNGSHR